MKKLLYRLPIVVLAACGTTKKVATLPSDGGVSNSQSATNKEETAASVLSKLNTVDFKTFAGKVDVDFDDGKGNAKSVSAKLVIKKDEAIWLSAGLLGFEGVRVLITKDSVKILNKLQKEYTATSLTYIQNKIGLPADFTTLQNLLIGNAVFINKDNASLAQEGTNYFITSKEAQFNSLLTVLMPGYLPSEIKLNDTEAASNKSATLRYSNYTSTSGRQFSTIRNISVLHKNNIIIQLNFKSHDFDGQVSTPFAVPSGYTPKQ